MAKKTKTSSALAQSARKTKVEMLPIEEVVAIVSGLAQAMAELGITDIGVIAEIAARAGQRQAIADLRAQIVKMQQAAQDQQQAAQNEINALMQKLQALESQQG